MLDLVQGKPNVLCGCPFLPSRILCWWGIWTLTISPSTNGTLPSSAKAAQYGAVVSPLFTMLVLLFFSGIPTAEKPQARRVYLSGDANAWEAYRAYLDDTSILIPIPPALYRPCPRWSNA
ncbi:hypothetical protein BJV77DRAFT_707955 [Russula vinacea]|nr:hypothetical protein BJV77DRAFT_707955 [Russula vinacea]